LWAFARNLWESLAVGKSPEVYIDRTLGNIGELLQPWEKLTEIAPEEEDVPHPVQFETAAAFLGMPREEAVKQYLDQFEEHISTEFSEQTNIKELLRTKGVKVFVPDNWSGIQGIEPLDVQFKDTLPDRMKPRARPINPRLWEVAEKEFMRLKTYFYEESRSPIASCLVVAPKATKPFIRFCGDYVEINKHIEIGHYNIPNVKHELDKVVDYSIYGDIDMTNAFHQITLTKKSSKILSIQTPWGQYEPKFMPEGIGPGSGILQETVKKIFADLPWAILIFDNILIMAHNYQDLYEKFEIFLDRCIQHNVALKFSKSWLGVKEVKFFGYLCKHKSYELTEDRKLALDSIPFPETGKRGGKIRSMLGSGVFFSPFVKNYSDHVKHLTDLAKDSFDWDESTWKHDYRQEFEDYKAALKKSCAIYFPNYELNWIVRTDASELGIGGVLIQIDTKDEEQIIALVSKKFSDPATRWSTMDQEAFAIYYVVKKLAYYLVGKDFIVETDHNNLRWMEASEVPKIIRQRIYLQSFSFTIRHIKGKLNVLPDTLSRLFVMYTMFDPFEEENEGAVHQQLNNVFDKNIVADENTVSIGENMDELMLTQEDMLRLIHLYRGTHWGAKETWRRLNKQFPGHGISFVKVSEFIDMCENCQKTRREFNYGLKPVIRHLKPPHSRSCMGIDAVAITPMGAEGHTHINVCCNLFTKQAYLYPVKGCTAVNLVHTI
jgi:hypothetical protein